MSIIIITIISLLHPSTVLSQSAMLGWLLAPQPCKMQECSPTAVERFTDTTDTNHITESSLHTDWPYQCAPAVPGAPAALWQSPGVPPWRHTAEHSSSPATHTHTHTHACTRTHTHTTSIMPWKKPAFSNCTNCQYNCKHTPLKWDHKCTQLQQKGG